MVSITNNFFKRKREILIFSVISLIFGVIFMNKGITGNVIINNELPINLIPIIGLLLVICSIILVSYSLKKEE